MERFWLGTHMPSWLRLTDVPLFISRNRLTRYKTLPRAIGPWALDSGGFTELQRHGRWTVSPEQYVADVRRYRDEIGNMVWAAPQDWMCERIVIEGGTVGSQRFVGTGLSVYIHQRRTVANLMHLRRLAPDLPFVPVLQGETGADYLRHAQMYETAGVRLASEPLVGIGSVCRRQTFDEIVDAIGQLAAMGIRLHGFGVKTAGLPALAGDLVSSDSLAWSDRGRHEPGCSSTHKTEANCLPFALRWRNRVLDVAGLS
jgi:hypothetical protein